jgi:hypothetical protein
MRSEGREAVLRRKSGKILPRERRYYRQQQGRKGLLPGKR